MIALILGAVGLRGSLLQAPVLIDRHAAILERSRYAAAAPSLPAANSGARTSASGASLMTW